MFCRSSKIAASIAAFLAALPAVGTRAFAAACPPSAIVEGPAAIARPIATLLRRHGVEPGPSRCGNSPVRAVLSGGGGQKAYVLRIEDRFGRSNDREVASAETAASLIESWVLGEDADLLAPRPGPPPPAEAGILATAAPVVPPRARPFVMGAAEISAASDGSTWYGGSGVGCVTAGPLCVGGRVRFARTAGAADSILGGQLTRSAVGATAIAALRLGHGRFSLAPTLELGAVWAHSALAFDPVTVAADDLALRAEGAVIAGLSIAAGWSLLAELGGGWGPVVSTGARPGTAGMPVPVPLPLFPAASVHGGIGIGFSP